MKRYPTIEWQVAGACNYDCTYCIQSKKYRKGRPKLTQLEKAMHFFSALKGEWEIKCSGGEAFAHRLFMSYIVPQLMAQTPHNISVLSNFSASYSELQRFAFLTQGRLKVFSASMHLEFAKLEEFLHKVLWFCDLLSLDNKFVVNQVVLPGKEDEALRCKEAFEQEGVRWFPQLYKIKGGVAEYPNEAALRAVIGENPGPKEANLAPSYFGKRCWAGVEYCTIDKDGTVWSCRTAKRYGQGILGNIFEGTVSMYPEPYVCPYTICPCTVPANRGMIEGVA
ncbi:MAG: hypothetical protein VX278_21405 [Myxococcota bacterium]|nr:hypothetical protein [Myxococcota bacterium]